MLISDVAQSGLTLRQIGAVGMQMPAQTHLDAVQLLACALASCTWTTLATYGERFDTSADDIEIKVRWALGDGPKRVATMSLDISWPSLLESRLDAATRAARHCTIHATLTHGCEVDAFVDH
jgi:uncharacterized OsmC-like protein